MSILNKFVSYYFTSNIGLNVVLSLADDSEAGTAYPSGECEFIPAFRVTFSDLTYQLRTFGFLNKTTANDFFCSQGA
jgi:hypothetical protein